MKVIVYGASDDLIEIEGDIEEEFPCMLEDEESRVLAFSDGTLLRVRYDQDGIWRLDRLVEGTAVMVKVCGDVEKDTMDKVTLTEATIRWVVLGKDYEIRKQTKKS